MTEEKLVIFYDVLNTLIDIEKNNSERDYTLLNALLKVRELAPLEAGEFESS